MKFRIELLDQSHAEKVNNLRHRAYQANKSLKVDNAGISWNRSDDQSIVLGIFENDNLLSTMRGEIINSKELVEKKLECPWTFGEIEFPVLILSKAAIDEKYLGKGFNSILRQIFFEHIDLWHVKSVLGTMTADSPRIESMKELGYQFYENKLGWQDDKYKSLEKVVVSSLNWNEYGKRSIGLLQQKYDRVIQTGFEKNFSNISYKEVTVVR